MIEKLKQADVMLVYLSLPPNGNMPLSGKEVTSALRANFPEMKIIILSVHKEENFIVQLIECGAHGYLVKDSDPNEVYEAITSAYRKGSYINRTLNSSKNG